MGSKFASMLLLCIVALTATTLAAPRLITEGDTNELLKEIELPEGFSISLYASGMPFVRSLVKSTKTPGVTYAGSFNFRGIDTPDTLQTNVYAMHDTNNDGVADKVYVIAANVTGPNGVAFHEGNLYIAQNDRILIIRDVEKDFNNPPKPELLVKFIDKDLIKPNIYWHGWRYIRFSPAPENLLYLAIGAPCNTPTDPVGGTCACMLQYDEVACAANQYCLSCKAGDFPGPMQNIGQIVTMRPDGTDIQVYASGMRNSLGFDWHPETKELWWTENGRDNWSPGHDNRPPDELNHAPRRGLHFGYPFCYGYNASDDEFNTKQNCDDYVGAAQELGPHVAALGMRFYTGSMFPDEFQGGVFIAEHGSWNRKPPLGYRVSFVPLNDELKADGYTTFASGWLNETGPTEPSGLGATWGRLADVEVLEDGSLLISNELRGEVYRVTYRSLNSIWIGVVIGAIALVVLAASIGIAVYLDRKRRYVTLD